MRFSTASAILVAGLFATTSTAAIAQSADGVTNDDRRISPIDAADQTGSAAAQPVVPSTAEAQSTPQESGIQDIVVTANRREQRLQEVPTAITAISGDTLERSGVTNPQQLTQIAPGLNFVRANTGFQPILRGVGTRNSATGDEPNVSLYLDGVYQPEMSANFFELANVERIEVLRGPQGTLFGRNATGGLINIITSDPSLTEASARAMIGIGRFSALEGSFYGETPLSQTLAVSLSFTGRRDTGYIRDITRNEFVGDREAYGIRGKVLFEPSDSARFLLTLGYSRVDDASGYTSQPLNGNTAARAVNPNVLIPTQPWTTAPTIPQEAESNQFSAAFAMRFRLGELTLESTTAYQDSRIPISTTDEDGTPQPVLRIVGKPRSDYYSQELRLISPSTGRFQWIVGAFAFGGGGGFDPVTVTANGVQVQSFTARQDTTSYAGFAEATWQFADNWFLLAGVRYTDENHEYSGRSYNAANQVTASVSGIERNDGQFSYRASLRREFDFGNIYASYSHGFKSGTFNSAAFSATPISVEPETIDAFEVGIKTDPAPWLRANLSMFYYDFFNLQLTGRDPVTGITQLTNAPQARMQGGELEVTIAPSPRFNFSGYVTYLDARYTDFPNAQIYNPRFINGLPSGNIGTIGSVTGNRVIRAPDYTIGANFTYNTDTSLGHFEASTNIYHTGRFFWDVNNRLAQPAYTRINAELSLTPPNTRIRLSLWAQNLLNEVIYQQVLPTTTSDLVAFDRPRTFGARIRFEF